MTRLISIVLQALLIWMACSSLVFAQTPSADPCAFAEDFTEAQLDYFEKEIAQSAPVRYFEVAKKTKIVVSENSNLLGPSVSSENEENTILIPKIFNKLHCRIVVIGFLTDSDTMVNRYIRQSLEKDFKDCRDVVVKCMDYSINLQWDKIVALMDKNDFFFSDLDITTRISIKFLLYHEFYHLVSDDEDKLVNTNPAYEEFLADVYANMIQSVRSSSLYISIFYFRGLAIFTEGGSINHEKIKCREDNLAYISNETVFQGLAVTSFPDVDNEFDEETFQKRREFVKEIASKGYTASLFTRTRSLDCAGFPVTALTEYHEDLVKLAAFQSKYVDNIGDYRQPVKGNVLLRELIAIPMKSRYGKSIRGHVTYSYLRWMIKMNTDPVYIDTISDIIASDDVDDMLSGDFGRIIAIKTINEASEFSFIESDEDRIKYNLIITNFNRAIYYNPDFALQYVHLGILYMKGNDCNNALSSFELAIEKTDADSTDAAVYLQRLANEVRRQISVGTCDLATLVDAQ